LHAGGDLTLAKDRGEIVFGDIVHLLNARSADIDATERAGIAVGNGGNDAKELVGGQGTVGGLDVGEGLGNAELLIIRSIGKAKRLSDSRVKLLNDWGKGTRLSIAEDRLKVCGAASGYVGDNRGEVVVGTRAERAESLQPGVNRRDDGIAGPLQENLEEAAGIEARCPRASSDGKDGTLTLRRNVTDLSECATNSRSNE